MDVLLQNCDAYLRLCVSLQAGAGAGKTKLDRYRLKTCRNHVVSFTDRTVTPNYLCIYVINTYKMQNKSIHHTNTANIYKQYPFNRKSPLYALRLSRTCQT